MADPAEGVSEKDAPRDHSARISTSPGRLGEEALKVLGSRARPDLTWISRVAGCELSEAELSLGDLDSHSVAVRELTENISRTGRTYYAQFPAPLDLFALVRLVRPRTIVESGVASGVSSTFLLLGVKSNGRGKVHSIDLPVQRNKAGGNESWAIPRGLSSGWAVPSALRPTWDLRLGQSEELLKPLLGEIKALDFYCHDSPVDVEHFRFEMRAILPHLRPGSLVVADNTDWEVFKSAAESLGAMPIRRKKSDLGAFRVPGRK